MQAKEKPRRSILLRILLLCFAVYISYTLIDLQIELVDKKKVLSERETLLNEKTATVNELTRLLETGDEKELIEIAARERLGYVYPDEQVFIDPSGN